MNKFFYSISFIIACTLTSCSYGAQPDPWYKSIPGFQFVVGTAQKIGPALSWAKEGVSGAGKGMWDTSKNRCAKVGSGLWSVGSAIGGGISGTWDASKTGCTKVGSGLGSMASGLYSAATSLPGKIRASPEKIKAGLSFSPESYLGSMVRSGGYKFCAVIGGLEEGAGKIKASPEKIKAGLSFKREAYLGSTVRSAGYKFSDFIENKFGSAIEKVEEECDRVIEEVKEGCGDVKKAVGEEVGKGVDELCQRSAKKIVGELNTELVDPFIKKFKGTLMFGSALFVGCIASYYLLKFISNQVDDYTRRPCLLYEKIAFDPDDSIAHSSFRDMVFPTSLKSQLNSLLISTEIMTRKKAEKQDDDSLFSNIVFSGMHGLGKHMFAQELARFAGMDFYDIKSSSLVKFKNNEAEIALDDFFKEVEGSSRRPALIYIDNASVLFSKYMSDNPSDIGRMIKLFVEKTERRSSKFMLIMGVTERPSFDNDMSSVIDDIIEFKAPELEERIKIMEIYRDKLFLTAEDVKPAFATIALEFLHDTKIRELAEQLNNLSVADIVSFVKTLKTESQLPYEGAISESIINRVLQRTISKYVNNLISR